MTHRKWKETKQQPGRHSWARQHTWLLLSFFPFPVGHPVAAPGRPPTRPLRFLRANKFSLENASRGLHLLKVYSEEQHYLLRIRFFEYRASILNSLFLEELY